MMIELPEELEAALKTQANSRGLSSARYVLDILEKNLGQSADTTAKKAPFKTGFGSFAKYGPAPSAEEIDANRAEMMGNFGEEF